MGIYEWKGDGTFLWTVADITRLNSIKEWAGACVLLDIFWLFCSPYRMPALGGLTFIFMKWVALLRNILYLFLDNNTLY